jgi:hypothetical protein
MMTRRRAALLAALLLMPGAARADDTGLGFELPGHTDGGAFDRPLANATIAPPAMGQSTPAPVTLTIAKACQGCSFALVHLARVRVSSDDDTLTFADPGKRFSQPVVLRLGTADNHGDGTTPGAFWSPLHDYWAIAPVATDGTIAATWRSGDWYASYCNGAACMDGATLTLEVASPLVPATTDGALLAHFSSERRQAYQAFNPTTVDDTIDLAASLPGVSVDAPLYFGAVEADRISGDYTLLQVNDQTTELACSDSNAFTGTGAGAAYSPNHSHTVAWGGSSDGKLRVQSVHGGFIANNPSGTTTSLSVAIDGWVGGSAPGGEPFHPGDASVIRAVLDGGTHGKGAIVLPANLLPDGQLPDVVVALVTTRGIASDVVQVTLGDKVMQFGTSTARMAGAAAGADRNPGHTDLVFAHPQLVAGAPVLPIQVAVGGWVDVKDPPASVDDPKPGAGVYVQLLGAFSPTVETPTMTSPTNAGGCQLGGGRSSLPFAGALLALACAALLRRRARAVPPTGQLERQDPGAPRR